MKDKANLLIGIGFLLVYIGLFTYIARFIGPVGDDYFDYSFFTYSSGVVQCVINYWNEVGGRFTGAFIVALLNSLGAMENYYVQTVLAMALSLFSLYFAVTSLSNNIKTSSKIFITLLL